MRKDRFIGHMAIIIRIKIGNGSCLGSFLIGVIIFLGVLILG